LRTLFNLCSALDVSPGDVIRDVEQHVKRPR
jgi:DNA-binding Xre family transcriptional regulator